MPGNDDSIIRVQGSLVHLDAGPARLLAQVREGNDVFLTACAPDGRARHERMPGGIRRARYRLGDRSIETTPASSFVAVTTEDGALVVTVLAGEAVLVSGDDRTAIAAGETLTVEPTGGTRVAATTALSPDERGLVDRAVDEAVAALALPLPEVEPEVVPAAAVETEPKPDPEPVAEPTAEPEGVEEPATAEEAHIAEADLEDDTAEETVERRGIAVGIALGAIIAVALLLAALTVLPDTEVATEQPTTTTEAALTTTTAEPETTTTERPATTTTERPTTTTARPTTTTSSRRTTTTLRPVPSYIVQPGSCRQSGETVTFSGEITNNDDEAWRFTVTVVFRDADGETLSSGEAEVGPVAPGATQAFSVEGRAPRPASSCDVDNVDARVA